MILKCGNGEEWHYIDGIKALTHLKVADKDKPVEENVLNLFIPTTYDDETSVHKTMFLDFGTGEAVIYNVRAPLIYLVSDEGKTIERIN